MAHEIEAELILHAENPPFTVYVAVIDQGSETLTGK